MIKHRTLLDFVLGLLYILRDQGTKGLMNLNVLLDYLEYKYNPSELHDIARFLEAKGYIRALYTFGATHVELTSLGIIYVEDNEDKVLEPLGQYLADLGKPKAQFMYAQSEEAILNPTIEQIREERKRIFQTIGKIEKLYKAKLGVKSHDLVKDLDVLRAELEKTEPDKDIIENKLNVIGNVELSRLLFKDLVDMMNIRA